MTAQDFKPRMDITGLTTVSATQIQQITATALPASDKGLVIVTTDVIYNQPVVPNPSVQLEGVLPDYWTRYIWIRKPLAGVGGRNVVYTWNNNRTSDNILLKWEAIDELINDAISGSEEALQKANEALSKANEALAMSKLTDSELDDVQATLAGIEEDLATHKTLIDGLLKKQPAVGVDNGSTNVLYIVKVEPVQTDLVDGQVIRFICPITCGFEPKLQMMDYGTEAVPEVPAIPAEGDKPAVPAVPAKPAVPPKNIGIATYLSRVGSMGNQMRVYTGDMVKGQYIEVTYNKVLDLWCLTLPVTVDGIASGFDLKVRTNPLAPTTSVSIRAHAITLTNNLSVGSRIKHSADLICNIAAPVGLGGLDAGAKTPNTWYYIWVVFNPDTKALSTLLSLSGYNPTIPAGSGYTHKCMVGQVYNDAGSNFRDFYQIDNTVWFAPVQIFNDKTGSAAAYQPLDPAEQNTLNTLVPLNAISVSGNMGKSQAPSGELCVMYLASNTTGIGEVIICGGASAAQNGWAFAGSFKDIPLMTQLIDPTLPLESLHQLYWKTSENTQFHRLQISSYKFHSIYLWN